MEKKVINGNAYIIQLVLKVVFIMDDETLKKIAYVNISSYRNKTVKALQNEVKTPTDISKDTGINRSHMSNVLRELKQSGIVECVNEEVRKGRIYRLTSTGEEIVEHLE